MLGRRRRRREPGRGRNERGRRQQGSHRGRRAWCPRQGETLGGGWQGVAPWWGCDGESRRWGGRRRNRLKRGERFLGGSLLGDGLLPPLRARELWPILMLLLFHISRLLQYQATHPLVPDQKTKYSTYRHSVRCVGCYLHLPTLGTVGFEGQGLNHRTSANQQAGSQRRLQRINPNLTQPLARLEVGKQSHERIGVGESCEK